MFLEVVGSRRPWLWECREECHDAVSAALEKRFGRVEGDDMAAKLEVISGRLARERWNDRRKSVLEIVPGSFLEEFDALNVEVAFQRAASVSVAYALMSRCGLELEERFGRDDFLSVFNFNTAAAVFALGSAVNESAEQALLNLEHAVFLLGCSGKVPRSQRLTSFLNPLFQNPYKNLILTFQM